MNKSDKVLNIIESFDMNLLVQQISPYIKNYEIWFKRAFNVPATWHHLGGFMKDKDKLRIQFRTEDKIPNIKGFCMYISYDSGNDLYIVETCYYDESGIYWIGKDTGIYFDMLDEPDLFYPEHETKDAIRRSNVKSK